jgi:hypothetical protein
MKTETYTCHFPSYAICALEYGDYSAFAINPEREDQDIKNVESFDLEMLEMQNELNATSRTYSYGEDEFFSSDPVFGLASTCVDLTVTFLINDKSN